MNGILKAFFVNAVTFVVVYAGYILAYVLMDLLLEDEMTSFGKMAYDALIPSFLITFALAFAIRKKPAKKTADTAGKKKNKKR